MDHQRTQCPLNPPKWTLIDGIEKSALCQNSKMKEAANSGGLFLVASTL